MTVKKENSKKTVTPKAAPKVTPKKITKKEADVAKFIAVYAVMRHPFQHVNIPTGHPGVMLDEDSWTKCQLDAGLLKKV